MTLQVPWHDDYSNWRFSENSPTQGRRFANFMKELDKQGVKHEVYEPSMATVSELSFAHTIEYVESVVVNGMSGEWGGERFDLADIARYMAGGTIDGARMIMKGDVTRVFNPTGAKHHAQVNKSSGFCVFADLAIAAKMLSQRMGWSVSIIDIDAHHGDGTENVCLAYPHIQTISVHEDGIFPGTGTISIPKHNAWNFPLRGESGDYQLKKALITARWLIEQHQPDIILVAAGADGHREDPLSTLKYSLEAYSEFGAWLNDLSNDLCEGRLLIGGAGGYRPDDYTPLAWANIAAEVAE